MNARMGTSAVAELISSIGHETDRAGSAVRVRPGWDGSSLPAMLLDRLGAGVCVIDAALTLVYANAASESYIVQPYFAGGARLAIDPGKPGGRQVLAAVLGAINGRSQMFASPDNSVPRLLAFSPLRLVDGSRAAMVTVERDSGVSEGTLSAYAQMIGLTRREAAVLGALAQGIEPREVAHRLGIAVETVRTHIRALLNKARVGCIRELVVRVTAAPVI